jgi:hypothetical protein
MLVVIVVRESDRYDNQFSVSDRLCECDRQHRNSKLRAVLDSDEVDNEPVCSGGLLQKVMV